MDFGAFLVVFVDPYDTDFRHRKDNKLPRVARIGDDLLVAGGGGVKHELAECATALAERLGLQIDAVFYVDIRVHHSMPRFLSSSS